MLSERDAQRLLAAADRVEITELLHRFHHAVDRRDWPAFDRVFTADAAIEFVSLNDIQIWGMEGRHEGRDAIVQWVQTGVGPFDFNGAPVHFMANHVVELDGDRATSRSWLHEIDLVTGLVICGGVYDARHVRTDDGWRIEFFHLGMWITRGAWDSIEAQRAAGTGTSPEA